MPRGTKLTADERRAILQLKAEGSKILHISRTLNRSRRVIERFLKNPRQYGIVKRTGRKKILNDGDESAIITKATSSALSYSKLAEVSSKNVSKSTVWRILQKARHISKAKLVKDQHANPSSKATKATLLRKYLERAGTNLPTQYERERLLYRNKPRKILNLEERVQAIRLYDKNPVYQRVASIFHCSWEQIKNIVLNRESILAYYGRCQMVLDSDGPRQVRNKKINFLGNAMYEYIKRAVYHNSAPLSDEILIEKAKEFRDILQIDKFFPSQVWAKDFKQVYNIDYENNEYILMCEEPPKSLKCSEIIAHCTREIEAAIAGGKEEAKLQHGNLERYYEPTDYEENANFSVNDSQDDGDFISNDFLQCEIGEHYPDDNGDNCEIVDNDDIIDLADAADNADMMDYESGSDKGGQTSDDKPESISSSYKKVPKLIIKQNKRIFSYTAALEALRPLEDFAVEREDFRAINLLSQLNEFYQKNIQKRAKNKK